MRFHTLARGAAALGIAALLTVTPALASDLTPNDRPETAVVLAGTVSGDLEAVPPTLGVGKQAFVRFEYPGDNSKVTIQVDVTPGDPSAASNSGFRVYGPTNGKLYATGGQTGRHPSHEVEFASTEAGTYLVEIYNANVKPIHYEVSAIGLPPQPAASPAPAVPAAQPSAVAPPAAPVVPIGQNTSADRAAPLAGSVAATLPGSTSGSFHFYQFDYKGDGSPVQIDLDVTPSDAQTAQATGFVIYGPTAGREYTRGGYTGKSPTHNTTLITNEPGTYTVQLFNYGPTPVQYRLTASGLPPAQPSTTVTTPAPAPPPADTATVGTNTSAGQAVELTDPVSAVLTGGAAASSHFYRFDYPGNLAVYRIDLDVTPSDPETGRTTGFVLYGPDGRELARGAFQGTTRPTHTAALSSNEPGTYLIQVFDSSPSAIAYRLSLSRP